MSKNITNIIDSWTKFDIKTVQRELDDKVIEIAQQLDDGDQSRKRLIEQTKEFRKTLNEDQKRLVSPILKLFQTEVDNSTKRNKSMEQLLLKLYKQMIELPDPLPSLDNAQRIQKKAERVQDLEIENKQLRETLEEYNVEFAEVKNQEVTIKNLKEKIKELEEQNEQLVIQKTKEKEKEIQRVFTEKEEQMRSSQLEMVKKLGDTEARCLSLQNQLQKTQAELFDLKSKQEEMLNAKTCEIDLLLQDLDKANERITNAERLVEQYIEKEKQNQHLKQHANNTEIEAAEKQRLNEQLNLNYRTSTLEIELASKEKEISQLVDDIQKLHAKSNKAMSFYEQQRSQLEERLANRERTLIQLENELRAKQDYDEIKRELSILKTIEFGSQVESSSAVLIGDSSLIGVPGAPSNTNSDLSQIQKPLEVLLLEKNRFLLNENTHLKNKFNDLQAHYEQIFQEHKNLSKVNIEQKKLIVELEKDLLNVATKNVSHSQSSSHELTIPIETALNDSTPSPKAVISLDSKDNINNKLNTSLSNEEEASAKTDSSLFNIVSNQRERFKIRVQELESEQISNRQQILFLTNELDRLRSDNVKLYEKIKFLQSASSKSTRVEEEFDTASASIINKYTQQYEQNLDPFSKFTLKEKQKRYTNLKLHDKFTLNLGRFILSSKTARLIFFGYIMVIHFLVFGSMYYTAHHYRDFSKVSSECAHQFRDHMHKEHGMASFSPTF